MGATSVIERPSAVSPVARPLFWILSATGLAALGFFYAYVTPYFTLTEAALGPYYWPRRWPLLVHVSAGTVALLAGPVQLWLGLTYTRPDWHRILGFTYVASVLVGSGAAFYLLADTGLGLGFRTGIGALALAWLTTTGMAFGAVRRGLIEQHREWMIRSYVVTTAFMIYRVLMYAFTALEIGATRPERRGIASWLCWAVPLLVTEAVIQGRKIFVPSPGRPREAA